MQVVPQSTTPPDRPSRRDPGEPHRAPGRVPRESVHKTAAREVFLRDAARRGDARFTVSAVWHRDHFLAHHGGPVSDPVVLAETARQAAIHLSHRFFDVPFDRAFVLSRLAVDLDEPLPPVPSTPLGLGLDAHCVRHTEKRRTAFELRAVARVAGRAAGRALVRWEVMEQRRYAVLRRRGTPAAGAAAGPADDTGALPLRPGQVGQRHGHDVFLAADAERADRWWLRLPPDHPVVFDHPSDHIPGMAFVEAFRQAVTASAPDARAGTTLRRLRSLDVEFTSFGEPELPVLISADHPDASGTPTLTRATQAGREVARARLGHAPAVARAVRAGAGR